jgi:hypothetical protein
VSTSYGPPRLLADLIELGYPAELVESPKKKPFIVIGGYVVELGKFAGRTIDLGLAATADFPKTVASSIHVRADPQLYEKTDTLAKVRNIIDSELGPEWRYWSKNFGWTGERSARRLMSQINRIFQDA